MAGTAVAKSQLSPRREQTTDGPGRLHNGPRGELLGGGRGVVGFSGDGRHASHKVHDWGGLRHSDQSPPIGPVHKGRSRHGS